MKNSMRSLILALQGIAIFLFLVSPGMGQQIEMSLQEINQQSDVIVQAKVVSKESKWVYSAEGKNIITSTHFRVIETIKGEILKNASFVLDMPGGKVGDITQYVSTSVVFDLDEESVLFLKKDPDYVIGGYQGKFPVTGGKVYLENQRISSNQFADILKKSKDNPEALSSFLKDIRVEPVKETDSRLKGGEVHTYNSTNDTYTITGLKSNFYGTLDSDNDGYFETFSFQVQVNGDAVPGPATVYYKINCPTTGQSWTSVNPYVITGTEVDYRNFTFTESNFAGKITGDIELEFTVQLLDESKNVLASDNTLDGDAIKVDPPGNPTLTISAISPDLASAGTGSQVTISGSNFGATQGTGKVEFFYRDGQPKMGANIVSWSSTQIVCIVPTKTIDGYPASAGSGNVTVVNDAGNTSNGYPFKVSFGYGGTKWSTNTVPYRINENLTTATGEGQSIQNAAETWNAANADFSFDYDGTHTNTAAASNGHNDIVWGTIANSSTIGQASVWYSGNFITECDIVFNNSFTWSTGASVPSSSIDVETIALHELGHWLNLRDLYGSYNDGINDQAKAMYGFSYYGQSKRDLHADDAAGIIWIYGQASTVSLSGYVKTGGGTAVSNVVMEGLPGSPQTNASGFYTADIAIGWSGVVTPVKAGYTFYLATHTYSNQTTSLTNQDFTATASSNDATLSDLKVGGTTVTGFSKNVINYAVELPKGTTAVPAVTATTTDTGASKNITPASSIPGSTTVLVTAQDGTTTKTYMVNFTLARNTDATLSDLKVSGTTVSGFSETVRTYNTELPFGTSTVPVVTATTTDPNATKTITPAASLPGSTTVRVAAEDGITELTYTINFTLAQPSTDANLSDLRISGSSVSGFSATTLSYDVVLPQGTTAVPVVTASTNDAAATKVIQAATSLPGTTTVVVTAQDGTTRKTYSVNFSVIKSSDATLSDLQVYGTTVDGFSSTTLAYNVELQFGSSAVPPVTATVNESHATKTITPATGLPGTTSVQVIAENGTTTQTYTINFTVAKNDDASLSDLRISGTTIEGFTKNTLAYYVQLPFGTTSVPSVTATPSDNNATRLITPATALPGSTIIVVTAENGTTNQTYTIFFTLEPASTEATLSNLMVNGATVPGFSPAVTFYSVTLPNGTTAVPTVTATTSDSNASEVITPAQYLPGTTTVVVTAQNGTTRETYSINFTVAKNDDTSLADLKVDGTTVDGFSPNTLNYNVVLPFGTTIIPTVSGTPADSRATRVITQATTMPGAATVQVFAENGVSSQTYNVYFTLTSPSTDATLTSLLVDGEPVSGFSVNNLNYQITLAHGTTRVPDVQAVASSARASVVMMRATSLPGATSVQVTAQDGLTRSTYSVYFNLAKNSDATLADLLINGSTISNFDGQNHSYEVVIPLGSTTPPSITPVVNDENASTEVIMPLALPGSAIIRVTAEDRVTTNSYEIYIRYPASGIDDNSNKQTLTVYPNPNRGQFTVEYTRLNPGPVRISLIDLSGRTVLDEWCEGNPGQFSKSIELPEHRQGAYFLRLIDGAQVSYKKIIVE